MDCKTSRLLLELGLPRAQELEPDEAASLDEHLAACAECGALAHEERRADAHLGAALRAVPVPPGLRDRLLDKLKAEHTAQERRRWLRFRAPLAAAAALLLAVGVWWSNRPLPVIDLLEIHAQSPPRRAAEMEELFAKEGLRGTVVPPQFNYNLLAAWHVVEFQGRSRVPHLRFQNGADYAEVYILSAKHFDFGTALQQGKADSGGYTVELLPHPTNPHVFYLVKYPGRSLQPFLIEESRQTTT